MSFDIFEKLLLSFFYHFYHLICLCNECYYLSAVVGCWSSVLLRKIIYIFDECSFDYTAFAFGGKAWILLTGFTLLIGSLSLPQLSVLSRSAIVVL